MEPTKTLKALKALQAKAKHRKLGLMTDAEAGEIIKAIRRGVATTEIDRTTGASHGTTYTRLGRWAMRRCTCVAAKE